MNILKEHIKRKDKLCGAISCLTDSGISEIFCNAGFDVVWVDLEHTYISPKDTVNHLNAVRANGKPAVVRLPQNDLTFTKKILEMGPEGVIFPMVRNVEEVNNLIDITLYPPYGTRGFGPMRGIGFGAIDMKEYVTDITRDICRFIQIEHIDCVENLEEIVKNPYIDGYIIGPNDLSASIGELGNAFCEENRKLVEKAVEILKDNGKYFGFAVGYDEATVKYWSKFNPDFIFAGQDWNYLYSESKRTLDTLNKCFLNNE